MKLRLLLLISIIAALASASAYGSSVPNQGLKFALHIQAHADRTCNKGMPVLGSRDDLARVHDVYEDIDVFFVVFGYDSITGVEYGLVWPPEWGTAATTHCAEFSIGGITNPGEGISMTWSSCQTLGPRPSVWPVAWHWLLPTSDGHIEMISNPATDALVASACAFQECEPESVFYAGVNVDPYEGPPGGSVAVEPTTWGAIKAMFQ